MQKGTQKKIPHDIKWKRQQLARRRRRALVRLFFIFLILLVLLAGLLFAGYKVVSWGMDAYGVYQAQYAAYEERQQAWRGDVNPAFAGYTNVLVMGLDDGVDVGGQGNQKADTVLVLSLDNQTGAVRVINIPDNTLVTVAGSTAQTPIKNVYEMGGASLMARTVDNLLGISIHQYIALDMQTLAELIDALGGMDLYVEKPMDYDDAESNTAIHLEQGYQHLTGAQAVSYLRFQSDDMGEIGRTQRQQKFVKTLYEQVVSLDTVPRLPLIAEIFKTKVKMSAEIFDAAHFANVLRHLQTGEPESVMLPGAPADNNVFMPNAAEIQTKMQDLFPSDKTEDNSVDENTSTNDKDS